MTVRTILFCDGAGCSNQVPMIDKLERGFVASGWVEFRPLNAAWELSFCSYACLGGYVADKLLEIQKRAEKNNELNRPLENITFKKDWKHPKDPHNPKETK